MSSSGIWGWISDPAKRALVSWVGTGIAAIVVGSWTLYTYFSEHGGQALNDTNLGNQLIGLNNTAKAFGQGVAINAGGDVDVTIGSKADVNAIVEKLESTHQAQLSRLEQEKQAWKTQAQAAVEALANLRGEKDAPPGINEALALLKQGNTQAAEGIFQAVAHRKEANITATSKEAAAAYRHLGALASLNDTRKALEAYRRATELDTDNVIGWNALGQLLERTGELSKAEEAYRRIMSLGQVQNNRSSLAMAYRNLGSICQTRGDLDQAEAMQRKSLEINKTLQDKEGMAGNYINLGNVYGIQGYLDQAEDMFQKSLEINKALGRKEDIAIDYGNLGNVYLLRDDFDQAEAMHRTSFEIDKALGNKKRMAGDYGNLGNVYLFRGYVDQAEGMFQKSLEIEKALLHKIGMANAFASLGNVYKIRGDPYQAEAKYRRAQSLFKQLGAKHQSAKVQQSLDALRRR